MNRTYAVLMDGGFVVKKLQKQLDRFPEPEDITKHCGKISTHDAMKGANLLRYYFYHAPPAQKTVTNPIDKKQIKLGQTPFAKASLSLLDKIELLPNFALRKGETQINGWKLGTQATKNIQKNPRAPEARDFEPDISQKGVDLRIGLDIARLSLQRLVDIIIVVGGDSDFVPAFKFARREGILVYLDHMGHNVSRDLKAHVDFIL